jgi:hypothetical protein
MLFDTTALPDLATFARANGLSYQPSAAAPAYSGAVFSYLQNATVSHRFTAGSGFELGIITGTIGGSQSRTIDGYTSTTSSSSNIPATYTYLAIPLPQVVPQLVLDSVRNGASLPMPVESGQRLSLEGDFDRYFRLYVPNGFERDALYVLTPDLMALLIDETGDFDVEVIDNKLFVYSVGALSLADSDVWVRLGRIHGIVGSKAASQTQNFTQSPQTTGIGQRLRMSAIPRDMRIVLWAFFGFFLLFLLASAVFMVFFAWIWFAGIDATTPSP